MNHDDETHYVMESDENMQITPNRVDVEEVGRQLQMREFNTRDDLLDAIRTFAVNEGFLVSIKKSKKDKWVSIGCDRGGTYRNRHNVPMENRRRRTSSRLINCSFEVQGKRKIEGHWILKVVNLSHNHEMSKDMSGHPCRRRFGKEKAVEIEKMIKSGVSTRQILASMKLSDKSDQSIAKTVHNLKSKIRKEYLAGRTVIQALLDELGKGGFTYNFLCDSDSRVIRLFFAHPASIALTRSYPDVFIMDCTYKTNKYRMPLLEIIGISIFNTSFCSCFVFLQQEREEDYTWALEMFKEILNDGSKPSVIVTDRELSLMQAIRNVFPASTNILCVWHIEKNILARCKSYFVEGEDWDAFLSTWTAVVNSITESEYEKTLQLFEERYKEKPLALNYIKATWLPFKEQFVSAWTDRVTHFGTRVSSRAESAHAMIKKYLQVSTGDLCQVRNRICNAITNQFQEIKVKFESEKMRIPHCFQIPLFQELVTKVSLFALNKLWEQYELANSGDGLPFCKDQFSRTMGLPCAHRIRSLQETTISIVEIHPQWRLDVRSFEDYRLVQSSEVDHFKSLLDQLQNKYMECPIQNKKAIQQQISSIVNEPAPLLYDPLIQPHKGRPFGSKNKRVNCSTRRDPSAFEIVENRRQCSKCKGYGHNSRTCKYGAPSFSPALDQINSCSNQEVDSNEFISFAMTEELSSSWSCM